MSSPDESRIQLTAADVRRRRGKARKGRVLTNVYIVEKVPKTPRRRGAGRKKGKVVPHDFLDLAREPPTPTTRPPLRQPSPPAMAGSPQLTNDVADFEHHVDDEALTPTGSATRRRRGPRPITTAKFTLYERWNALLNRLKGPFLRSRHASAREADAPFCACTPRERRVVCVFWDRFEIKSVRACEHRPLPIALVELGLFPSGPSKPGYAFCTELLDFFMALTYHAADSAQALAAALHTYHVQRGYVMRGRTGQPVKEGYRRAMQQAFHWYRVLHHKIDADVEEIILTATPGQDTAFGAPTAPPRPTADSRAAPRTTTTTLPLHALAFPTCEDGNESVSDDDPELEQRDEVERVANLVREPAWVAEARRLGVSYGGVTAPDRYLIERCPACFASLEPGRPFSAGSDVHIAGDGNFGHRRLRNAGECPSVLFNFRAVVPTSFVNAVGAVLDAQRRGKPRPYQSRVDVSILVQCEESHTAGNGANEKTPGDIYDDRGLMALVCRHDIPLYLCNIDTPGEQQKYWIALLIWFMLHLPDNCTITSWYDINCVSWRVLMAYDVMPEWMLHRLEQLTSVLHSYAHQWECQLVFGPRMRVGAALTDGEGTERFWSRLRYLIGVLRHVSRGRRLMLLEMHTEYIAKTVRGELGRWLRRRYISLRDRRNAALQEVVRSGHSENYLRQQWCEQKDLQLSLRRHTAATLRREMQAVMDLQDQIDEVETRIEKAAAAFRLAPADRRTGYRQQIARLRETQHVLQEAAEALYASLQVGDGFPALAEFGYDFVKTLIQAYDAKRIARAKATARFFEYERLDQAVGGAGAPLGTTQHQRTLRGMKKRTPALVRAVARYNALCDALRAKLPEGLDFPLPEKLPIHLAELRNDPALLEDVWIEGVQGRSAPWLMDASVRRGIRAVHTIDRCNEEEVRLAREEDALYGWLKTKLAAVYAALEDENNEYYVPLLRTQLVRLEGLVLGCFGLTRFRSEWTALLHPPAPDEVPMEIDGTPPPRPRVHFLPTPPATPEAEYTDAAPEAPDADDELQDDDADELEELAAPQYDYIGEAFDNADPEEDFMDIYGGRVKLLKDKTLETRKLDLNLTNTVQTPATAYQATRRRRGAEGQFDRLDISAAQMEVLLGGGDVLDDAAMYACCAMLALIFPARMHTLAIFHPAVLAAWYESRTIGSILELVKRTPYASAEAVAIPLMSNGTWGMAFAYPAYRRIELYIPGAGAEPWALVSTAVAALMAALPSDKAQDHDFVWECSSLHVAASDCDAADSGPLALASLAAVMRFKRHTAMDPNDLSHLRRFLYNQLCMLSRVP